jgi:hypothetical protein
LRSKRLLEPLEHLVEGRRLLRDLVSALDRDAPAEIGFRDRAGRPGESRHRVDDPARETPGEERPDEQDADADRSRREHGGVVVRLDAVAKDRGNEDPLRLLLDGHGQRVVVDAPGGRVGVAALGALERGPARHELVVLVELVWHHRPATDVRLAPEDREERFVPRWHIALEEHVEDPLHVGSEGPAGPRIAALREPAKLVGLLSELRVDPVREPDLEDGVRHADEEDGRHREQADDVRQDARPEARREPEEVGRTRTQCRQARTRGRLRRHGERCRRRAHAPSVARAGEVKMRQE